MNYKEKITLTNKHHVSSALYHLERIMPSLTDFDQTIVGVQDLNTIREQLRLWEKELYITTQEEV